MIVGCVVSRHVAFHRTGDVPNTSASPGIEAGTMRDTCHNPTRRDSKKREMKRLANGMRNFHVRGSRKSRLRDEFGYV